MNTNARGPDGSELSDGLGPLPEPEWSTGLGVAYTPEQMRQYAAQAVAAERERWMVIACDGWRVLQGLDERSQKRTSHQNVSDTLDALVRVIRDA